MWPKALLELLPHITKLVPLANRYFQSKAADEDATRIAIERKLDAIAASLRIEIQQANASDPGVARQLRDQAHTLTEISAEVRTTRAAVETLEARLTRAEKAQSLQKWLVLIAILMLGLLFVYIPFELRSR